MFSDKENINILTSLLAAYPVRHAIVCPGSRNAPIVHNLHECESIDCHSVTDERSAGFYALGMAQATMSPVVVCVTSGSALLNVIPAVAEAYYQHIPLIVVSADRPAAWIDQLDGQTIHQDRTLEHFFLKSVTLPEPKDTTEKWYCNRLVNEALLSMTHDDKGPIHINIPVTEPLFNFNISKLPTEREIRRIGKTTNYHALNDGALSGFFTAERPMVVLGQMEQNEAACLPIDAISRHAVVLSEPLSEYIPGTRFEEFLATEKAYRASYMPDFILYVGGIIVSKRLKHFLRKATGAETWIVNGRGNVTDTFMNLQGIIEGTSKDVMNHIAVCIEKGTYPHDGSCEKKALKIKDTSSFREQWHEELTKASRHIANHAPRYSQMLAVKTFEQQLDNIQNKKCKVHYANSSAVRLGCIYAKHHIFCNRGVNGIEGCLSTAAGYSIINGMTFCVIGDLSFFYDQNALWNKELDNRFRILLLNNGCGGIFHRLEGLQDSPARDNYIAARHDTTAEGICRQNNIDYLQAHDTTELDRQISLLVNGSGNRPVLLEVFTDAIEDKEAIDKYYNERLKT